MGGERKRGIGEINLPEKSSIATNCGGPGGAAPGKTKNAAENA